MICKSCGVKHRTFRQIYGKPPSYFANKFDVSISTIIKRHNAGKLKAIIKKGKWTGDTLYRRKYDLSMAEIADKLGETRYTVGIWHHSGKLKGKLKEFRGE